MRCVMRARYYDRVRKVKEQKGTRRKMVPLKTSKLAAEEVAVPTQASSVGPRGSFLDVPTVGSENAAASLASQFAITTAKEVAPTFEDRPPSPPGSPPPAAVRNGCSLFVRAHLASCSCSTRCSRCFTDDELSARVWTGSAASPNSG